MSDRNALLPSFWFSSRRRFLASLLGGAGSLLALSRASWARMLPLAGSNTSPGSLAEGFQAPPPESRILMRWWWFGPDVNEDELRHELEVMQAAGIGGVEVNAVYPLTLDDPARHWVNLRYNGPGFLRCIRFAAETAKQLGLRFDLTMGSGWPFGGPWIPESLAAGKLHVVRIPVPVQATQVKLPAAPPEEEWIAGFVSGVAVQPDAEGIIAVPAGQERELLAFYAGHTHQQVKRAAFGAEGPVLDHYNRAALERHLSVLGDSLLQAAGPGNVTTAFCDSLEVFGSNWTPALLSEFQRRRGYDLTPHLPDLVDDHGAVTRAVRHDFGLTLTELLNDEFLQPFQQWCHRHGVKARVQAYGTPPAAVSSYRYVDFPEAEGRPWNQLSMNRWASSASHHFGVPVTSAETWTWIHSPAFRATPLDLKAGADQRFLAGINLLVGHGWPYSPAQAGEPGWRFYASGALNQHNPWWPVMPDLARYLQRMSWLLRQGEPANDVLLYAPNHDAWAEMDWRSPYLNTAIVKHIGPELVPSILNAGYNFDLIDDEILKDAAVRNGDLHVGRHAYHVVVLPAVETMPLATLEMLARFADQGGVLIADRRLPNDVPGLMASDADRARLRSLVQQLVEQGRIKQVASSADVGRTLHGLLAPDVQFDPPSNEIGFIHRTTPEAEIYFVANPGNRPYRGTVKLRTSTATVETWDALTGAAEQADGKTTSQGVAVPVDLAPYGSTVLIANRKAGVPAATVPSPATVLASLDLSRNWSVTFPKANRTIDMPALHSWSDEPGLRFYSGEAVYRKTVAMPAKMTDARRLILDFGEGKPLAIPTGSNMDDARNSARTWLDAPIRDAAVVYVNDQRAGSVWCPPYRLDVTRWMKPGVNHLEVRVTNTAMNEMAGEPRPDFTALYKRFGRRFEDQDVDRIYPLPSGLFGPIRLLAQS